MCTCAPLTLVYRYVCAMRWAIIRRMKKRSLVSITLLVLAAAAQADTSTSALLGDSRVKAALAKVKDEDARTLREQIEISQIPAPPYKEAARAQDYVSRLRALGLDRATLDAEGNVIALRKGAGKNAPTLVLSAHLDTVFPEGTDVTVTEKNGRYSGRGLSDDSRGLSVVLTVLRALQDSGIRTTGDVMFVGTVGEEGLGNLRGVKALFRDHPEIDGFISVDGIDSVAEHASRSKVVYQATGSRRWSVTFIGPGGHSSENFGNPSAIHAMGRAIARIGDIKPPTNPKTTFTVGIVSGGSAINAIAAEAQMQIDLRSNGSTELAAIEKQVFALLDDAVAEENARWGSQGIRTERKLLGDRPAAAGGTNTPLVSAAVAAYTALKLPAPELISASTDSNVPLGLGIPAITVSGGGRGDKAHSPDEWYEPVNAWLGPQTVLLTVLSSVGVEGVSKPQLPDRKR